MQVCLQFYFRLVYDQQLNLFQLSTEKYNISILFPALFPLIHLSTDAGVIKEKKANSRKMTRSVEVRKLMMVMVVKVTMSRWAATRSWG